MQWITWILTGIALALGFLLGMFLLGLARLSPPLARLFARSALAVFVLATLLRYCAARWFASYE